MSLIKALILDVDGVLVGAKKGINWPDPHPHVIKYLRQLRQSGIIVSLCTGKGTFAIKNIVISAHLDNIHIGDGGAIVIDFINNKIIAEHNVDKKLASLLIKEYLSHGHYMELYSVDDYFVQKNQVSEITPKHAAILGREPVLVDSLLALANKIKIVKIMPIAKDLTAKQQQTKLFSSFQKSLSLQWGTHPSASVYYFGIITAPNISKTYAAKLISKSTHIPFSHILGVGDGMTDWQFMKLCKYKAAMGNASQELKDIILAQDKKYAYIGKSVNENGIIDIFKHFGLN